MLIGSDPVVNPGVFQKLLLGFPHQSSQPNHRKIQRTTLQNPTTRNYNFYYDFMCLVTIRGKYKIKESKKRTFSLNWNFMQFCRVLFYYFILENILILIWCYMLLFFCIFLFCFSQNAEKNVLGKSIFYAKKAKKREEGKLYSLCAFRWEHLSPSILQMNF